VHTSRQLLALSRSVVEACSLKNRTAAEGVVPTAGFEPATAGCQTPGMEAGKSSVPRFRAFRATCPEPGFSRAKLRRLRPLSAYLSI